MQLNLQGRVVWMGFNEAFEAGIDRLYALYYKIPIEDGVIRVCVGLFRSLPPLTTAHLQLMGASNISDPMIDTAIIREFLQRGYTKYIEVGQPTYVSDSKTFIPPSF